MKIRLYGTRYCSYCMAGRKLLQKRGLPFEDIALDGVPDLRQKVRELSRRYTVPQIWIDEVHVGGYRGLSAWGNAGSWCPIKSLLGRVTATILSP